MGIFLREQTMLVIALSFGVNRLEASVEKMMGSVRLDAPATQNEQTAALFFRVEAVPPFHISANATGLAVSLTVGPKAIDPEHIQPESRSYESQLVPNLQELKEEAIHHITDPSRFLNGHIENKKPGTIAGVSGRIVSGSYEGEVNIPPRRKKVRHVPGYSS
ncbi:hypothetical protein E2F50_22715 [Rhizobium deserti]|uniref:Uncharacterized protein n=1 Tax=Rhizobium deserti TaxID=2547961 RepID=A0A4V3AN42_9HYPH|nr:hypothetical protein [Rhizobium deserti]TDK29312.1 hypothetical protein E2F50_22715 [Rhizobium deserti]